MFLVDRKWITIISLAIFAFSPFPKTGTKSQSFELPLAVSIVPSQMEIVCGEPMQWNLILNSSASLEIYQVNLIDTTAWNWAKLPPSKVTLTDMQSKVLRLSVVPLVSQSLQPGVQIFYRYKNQIFEQVVVSNPVRVISVPSLVHAEIVPGQKTIQVGDSFTTNLWVSNQTPFVLTNISIDGLGSDISWEKSVSYNNLLSKKSLNISILGKITGENPQPLLFVRYKWKDSNGQENEYSQYIQGDSLLISPKEPSLWERIPSEVYTALFGLIVGIVTSLGISWSKDLLERQLREKYNARKVKGMLEILILQAELAADRGLSASTGVIETIFQNDELYDVLLKFHLDNSVRILWRTVQEHNQNINNPAGAQRSEKLSVAAQSLKELMDSNISHR